MKHPEDELTRFEELCSAGGVGQTREISEQLLSYLDWLLEANKRLNLTALRSREDALRLHIVDSLTAVPELQQAPSGRLLDIGTGGGLPGLPLALATGRPTTLLDSVAKKARAVAEYTVQLRLDVEVLGVRAEELARERPAHFAVVVARAVAPLPSLVELAAPLLFAGGRLVCLKGQPLADELESGESVASKVGMSLVSDRCLTLPGGDESRRILTYEKTGGPSLSLPRRTGRAQTHPLA